MYFIRHNITLYPLYGRGGAGTVMAAKELQVKGFPFIPDSRGEMARPFHDCEFDFIHPGKLNWVLTEIGDNEGC
jgi:hypothetical protein